MYCLDSLFQLQVDPVALAEVSLANGGEPLELSNAGSVYLDQLGLRTQTHAQTQETETSSTHFD